MNEKSIHLLFQISEYSGCRMKTQQVRTSSSCWCESTNLYLKNFEIEILRPISKENKSLLNIFR